MQYKSYVRTFFKFIIDHGPNVGPVQLLENRHNIELAYIMIIHSLCPIVFQKVLRGAQIPSLFSK